MLYLPKLSRGTGAMQNKKLNNQADQDRTHEQNGKINRTVAVTVMQDMTLPNIYPFRA